MAVVAHQAHGDDPRIAARGLRQYIPGSVARPVVDQHDLAGTADPIQDGADPAQEFGQGVLLVVAGRHHGNGRAGCGIHSGGAITHAPWENERPLPPPPSVSPRATQSAIKRHHDVQ